MPGKLLYPEGTMPPPDARLIDPTARDFEPLPTPVDDRGLADIDGLIDLVKSTVDASYRWPTEASVHHFYWPAETYSDTTVPDDPYQRLSVFRELSIHKGYIPRVFENWLHLITAPPLVPEPEIRRYRVEAWLIARDLFKMARKTIVSERNIDKRHRQIQMQPTTIQGADTIGDEVLLEAWMRNFKGYEMQLERQGRIPPEHRLFELPESPHEAATSLGSFIAHRSLKLINRVAA